MQLQTAERKRAKIKMALQGPSGSGKTMSALLIAYGLCNDWQKIAVIDTENHSAELFAHLGNFQVLPLVAPFTPERYIEATELCVSKGIEVIIVDSLSHEWEGLGGILDNLSDMTGNSFTNWNKITPRHSAFIQTLLQAPVHVLSTIRSKQDYVLVEKDGKQVPEKVGLKAVQREGLDYEFTLVFEIDIKHNATSSKDRTTLFMDKPPFKITAETGRTILKWCNEGLSPAEEQQRLNNKISECKSFAELLQMYNLNPQFQESLKANFTKKRTELEQASQTKQIINQVKTSQNGTHN